MCIYLWYLTKQAWDVVPVLNLNWNKSAYTCFTCVSVDGHSIEDDAFLMAICSFLCTKAFACATTCAQLFINSDSSHAQFPLACMHSQPEQSVSGCTAGGSSCASATEAIGRQAGPVRQLTTGGTAAVSHCPTGPLGHQPTH